MNKFFEIIINKNNKQASSKASFNLVKRVIFLAEIS